MARPKRASDWAPITVRLSVEGARRLKVAAARMDRPQGQVLDDLILRHLPPADPLSPPDPRTRPASAQPLTIESVKRLMAQHGMNQSDVARALGITPKAVSEWFERGRIPTLRWPALRRLLAKGSKG